MKGLFTKAQDALRSGAIDAAVHSLKDLPVEDPDGLTLGAVPAREDARDVLVTRGDVLTGPRQPLASLREGATVGTSSPRRARAAVAARSDLETRDIRGNVPTRADKARRGDYDAVLLAAAGLNRLGLDLDGLVTELPVDVFRQPQVRGARGPVPRGRRARTRCARHHPRRRDGPLRRSRARRAARARRRLLDAARRAGRASARSLPHAGRAVRRRAERNAAGRGARRRPRSAGARPGRPMAPARRRPAPRATPRRSATRRREKRPDGRGRRRGRGRHFARLDYGQALEVGAPRSQPSWSKTRWRSPRRAPSADSSRPAPQRPAAVRSPGLRGGRCDRDR